MGDGREPVTWGNLISRLDDEGIDKAVLLPVEPSPEALISPHAALAERMNVRDQVVDAAAYPDRLIAFGNLDPRWGGNSPSADFGPLLDWFEAQGLADQVDGGSYLINGRPRASRACAAAACRRPAAATRPLSCPTCA